MIVFLVLGKSCSCGCKRKSHLIHNLCRTRLYHIHEHIKQRCYVENTPNYKNYGGRGIIMCDEWRNDFKVFYDWAMANGYKDDLTIDRIDNDGNYEPSNCRWTDNKTQSRNRRSNIWITYKGATHLLSDWADICHINPNTIMNRIRSLI